MANLQPPGGLPQSFDMKSEATRSHMTDDISEEITFQDLTLLRDCSASDVTRSRTANDDLSTGPSTRQAAAPSALRGSDASSRASGLFGALGVRFSMNNVSFSTVRDDGREANARLSVQSHSTAASTPRPSRFTSASTPGGRERFSTASLLSERRLPNIQDSFDPGSEIGSQAFNTPSSASSSFVSPPLAQPMQHKMLIDLMDKEGNIDLAGHRNSVGHALHKPPDWWRATIATVSTDYTPDGKKGPHYDPVISAYYSNSGRWSDGMGAACQRPELAVCCCFCPVWPLRLLLTLSRAAPLDIRLPCCSCTLLAHRALRAACGLTILILCLLLAPAVAVVLGWSWLKSAPRESLAMSAALLALPYGFGMLLWVLALSGVGRKYNVKDAGGLAFIFKTCCCLCVMNVRVGLHVDRAQGFWKANKYVQQIVNLSGHVRGSMKEFELAHSRETHTPAHWAPASTGSDMFQDEDIEKTINGLAESERRASRHSATIS